MDVKAPMVSFTKSRRAIAGTVDKLQIPALIYRGHSINSTAALPAVKLPTAMCCKYLLDDDDGDGEHKEIFSAMSAKEILQKKKGK